jgi:hypothetical protein
MTQTCKLGISLALGDGYMFSSVLIGEDELALNSTKD